MNIFKKAFYWIILSSENAQNLSLTVKAFLTGIIPVAMFLANTTHVKFDSNTLTAIIDGIASVITYLGGLITALVFLYGLFRKIVNTANGNNDVILQINSSVIK